MEQNHKKHRSMTTFFQRITIFPIIYFIFLLVGASLLAFFYVYTKNIILLFALIGFSVIFSGLYIFFSVFSMRHFQTLFVKGLYDVTLYNYRSISDNDSALITYPNRHYEEFEVLNAQVSTLKTELDASTLITSAKDFSHLSLDYLDVENNVITLKSFTENLEAIIYASQNYRNVIMEVYYEFNEESLNDEDMKYLIDLFKKTFGDYKNLLIIVAEDRKSLYLYFPRIDSLSKIRELVDEAMRNATICKRTPEGVSSLNANFSIVCYPHSDVHELLPDLKYAKRQGEVVNVYLPDRLTSLKETNILKNSMNLNTMSKLIAPLQNLNLSLEDSAKNRQEVERVIRSIRSYFSLDYAGIISFDEVRRRFYFSFQCQDKDAKALSKDNIIEKEFLFAMDNAKDKDSSYYFAFRSHAHNSLGRHLDRIGLESGFFYVLKEDEEILGAIYFFNRHKEFKIDSYIQESLVVLCDKIAAILLGERRDEEVNNSYQEIESLLKLSDYATYRVTHDDFTLLRTSLTARDLFPKAKIGEKCYKALYGLDKPCHNCPLLVGNKKVAKIGNENYETSLVLVNNKSTYRIMTLKNLHQQDGEQRYNPDLLVNSYGSLFEILSNAYLINGKGYILLLRVDNLSEIIDKKGSEGYLSVIREFIKRLKKRRNAVENVYFFNNQTIAVLYTEYGIIDVLNECERIYEISRGDPNQSEEDVTLNLTYLPIGYPRTFPNAESILKQAEQFANRGKFETGKNFIYFDDSAYSRSASKESYMLSVIEQSFGNKTFNVSLQPMVDAKSKHIFGAELLLRITDDFRNIVFRADELIKVAADHDKIGIISHALLEFIASLYRQYYNNVFAGLDFERLSINTDYSFFTDKNFYSDTKAYIDDLKLPKNFLCFEIPESDVANHLDEFKSITRQLKELHIVSVVDQYTGRFLSIEAIKNAGFEEVKISRNVINHIDSDRQRLNDAKSLLNNIKELGLKASVVGVENIDQYLLLKEIDDTCLMQGFYFYRPLEKQALIETVRGGNKQN